MKLIIILSFITSISKSKKHFIKPFLIFVLLPSASINSQTFDSIFIQAINKFSKEKLSQHINFLGSDSLEGRGTGSKGGYSAAEYLSGEFEKLKLKPVGGNNTFYQNIPMHRSTPLEESKLIIHSNENEIYLKLKKDYFLLKSGEETFIPTPLQLVFVGYGIIAHEFDYNDYQSIDVSGKIVVMLSGEPKSSDEKYFEGDKLTIYSYDEAKQRLAISRGAYGSIIIPNILEDGNAKWENAKKNLEFEYVTLAFTVTSNLSLIINPQKVNELFKGSNYSFEDILKMHSENKMQSFSLQPKRMF
ncbi:MAG: hypothetical protein ABI550_02885 [Ignavibacteriaceae bacterium]